ncbi:MAG: ATP-binding cassette domain-containing protein [Cyclobacteriaceae bacterium]|nr:ATP-binding cassette domain-containing protein [Cyclobacteriaceae bacterium]
MAKRRFSEDDGQPKAKLTREGLRKFLGIFRFVLPYRWVFALGLLSLALSSVTVLAFPFFAGKLLDVAQGKTWMFIDSISQIAFILMGILAVQSVFSFTRMFTFTKVSENALADLRHSVFDKMIWLPMSFYDSRRVGELMSRITSDVSTLQDTLTFTLAELLRQILVLVFGVTIIFVLTPKLTLFMLITFPVLVLAALAFGKFIRKQSKKIQDQLANANIVVEEALQSISVVKSFTNEWLEIGRYRKSLREVVDTAVTVGKYRGLFVSFSIVAFFGGIVAISWYGANLVQAGELTVGDLFSFVIYTSFIGGSIAGLGDIYSQVQKSIGASERLIEILHTPDEREPNPQHLKLKGQLSFENVSFEYPTRQDVTVLREIDFQVRPGERIALVGPSGAGKSTIISLLLRKYPVSHGVIRADGEDIQQYNLTSYRQNIGLVPQEVILFGGTIRENIAYGKPDATEEEIWQAARQANALEFIEGFPEKLNTLVGDRGVKLSGGQRQRIAIARAILKDPSILVLDEATSSLDAQSERLVQDALEKLMLNRTTFVIAHRLSTIRTADRILVIKDGRVAESGKHEELLLRDDGIYRNLLKLQVENSSVAPV